MHSPHSSILISLNSSFIQTISERTDPNCTTGQLFIPPVVPILEDTSGSSSIQGRSFCKTLESHILSLMAHPTDFEDPIIQALQNISAEELYAYRHPYYGSFLEASLKFIRPETLQFLLSQTPTLPHMRPLDMLSEEKLTDTLKNLAHLWRQHASSRGHREYGRPAVGFPATKKMTLMVAALYKAKSPQKNMLDLFSEGFKANASNTIFLKAVQGQTAYS